MFAGVIGRGIPESCRNFSERGNPRCSAGRKRTRDVARRAGNRRRGGGRRKEEKAEVSPEGGEGTLKWLKIAGNVNSDNGSRGRLAGNAPRISDIYVFPLKTTIGVPSPQIRGDAVMGDSVRYFRRRLHVTRWNIRDRIFLFMFTIKRRSEGGKRANNTVHSWIHR